jgi:hypothetical protein
MGSPTPSESGRVLSSLGASQGGKARAEKLTAEERQEIARKAAEARWNMPRATHEGELRIGDIVIPCAVLSTGQRLLTLSGFMRALGRARQAKGRQYYDGDVNMPAFLTAKNLKPFIPDDLRVTSSQLSFRTLKGKPAYGFDAELLPKVCYVFLDADRKGALVTAQKHIAERAHVLAKGLSQVGIIALVDEATGYQEIRDRLALQEILDKYLRKEQAAWAKRFSDDFYQEIFRLRGWTWRGMQINRPQCVAQYTKDLVYARLAPGILKELENRNPVTENGHRKARHHQFLTENIGHPALEQHLHAVKALMRSSDDRDWDGFYKRLGRALPKQAQMDLPLYDNLEASKDESTD